MDKTKVDIYKALKTNNMIVYVVVISATIISTTSIFFGFNAIKNADKYIYTTSEEIKLMPLERIEKEEVKQHFAKSHVELYLRYFYEIDQWNWRDRIDKSLWLIDDVSGKKIYEYYLKKGHYNNLTQTSSAQRIEDLNMIIKDGKVQVKFILAINKIGQKEPKRYLIEAISNIKEATVNYPLNPFGYILYNFVETNKKQL